MAETITKKLKTGEYIEAVGRRKKSVARVRIFAENKDSINVNERELTSYFPTKKLQGVGLDPISKANISQKFAVTALLKGGGKSAQAEALRHGLSRALVEFDPELRKKLKKLGFLTRDPRTKERKKFGLKKARKSPQWSKR